VHRTSAGAAHTFGILALPKGGFGVWGFCPPNPALAGNACRWALALKKFTEIAKATYTP